MDQSQLIRSASAAHASGQLAEAAKLCKQILKQEPHNAQALLLLGVVEAKVGDPTEALRLLSQVEHKDPNSFHAYFWQSHVFKKLGRPAEALNAARQANKLQPQDPQGVTQLGFCYQDVRLLAQAEDCFRKAVTLAPNVIPIQFNLSQCLLMQGKRKEAISTFKKAIETANPNPETLLRLTQTLLAQGSPALAAECARYALHLSPASVPIKLILGRCLLEDNRSQEAIAYLESAKAQGALGAEGAAALGTALQGLGRLDEAIQSFQNALSEKPDLGYAYFGIANSKRIAEEDRPMLDKMASLAKTPELPPKQISFLQYGLGKAHEDLAEYEQAMAAYDASNKIEYDLKFKDHPFNQEAYKSATSRTIRHFTQDFLAKSAEAGQQTDLPIFVVGMIRSGTTLVEQILACHPQAGAAGELAFWSDNWRSCLTEPQWDLNQEALKSASHRYTALLQEIAPSHPRVVDKMPTNYAHLGLIHLAFPKAKIIHTRRNPADTCLSIYATPNRASNEYAHNKANIVFAYRQYETLMSHWRKVIPPTALLELDYEDLVTNPEPVTRQILTFCGLEWNDACLKPHENKRAVITPSVWQVRQPFYRSSIDRWQHFEPWLGEFKALLTPEVP